MHNKKQIRRILNYAAYVNDYLAFDFCQQPSWRANNALSNNDMLTELTNWLNESASRSFSKKSKEEMLQHWITNTAKDEDLETENNNLSHCTLEDLKCALGFVHKESEAGKARALTSDLLCEFHKKALCSDTRRAGRLRVVSTDQVQVHCPLSNKIHLYPPAEQVSSHLTSLCDVINILILGWHQERYVEGKLTVEALNELIRLCAWAFYCLVSLHPFLDGNGRVARLALSYLLGIICPFPAALYCPNNNISRQVYLGVVIQTRLEAERANSFGLGWTLRPRPEQLATLLLESFYHSCRLFFQPEKFIAYDRSISNDSGIENNLDSHLDKHNMGRSTSNDSDIESNFDSNMDRSCSSSDDAFSSEEDVAPSDIPLVYSMPTVEVC